MLSEVFKGPTESPSACRPQRGGPWALRAKAGALPSRQGGRGHSRAAGLSSVRGGRLGRAAEGCADDGLQQWGMWGAELSPCSFRAPRTTAPISKLRGRERRVLSPGLASPIRWEGQCTAEVSVLSLGRAQT